MASSIAMSVYQRVNHLSSFIPCATKATALKEKFATGGAATATELPPSSTEPDVFHIIRGSKQNSRAKLSLNI